MAEEQVEVVKDEADREQFDGMKLVNKDPNKHYRFARKRDVNIARHKWNGYDIVDTTTDNVRSILNDSTRMKKGADVGTSIEIADEMILLSMPKELHEKRLQERENKIARRAKTVTSSYKEKVRQIAGPGIAYEEHRDNPQMRGMSEKSFLKHQEEQRQAAREENRKRG